MIARGDGSVLYNFAVAVDDADMGITDVIRGDDHLSNTPQQLLVLEALGGRAPRYAHLPLLHGPDGKKLSKRHGAASVQELREAGYLPAAVRNYLALLGWGTDDDTTILLDRRAGRALLDRAGRARRRRSSTSRSCAGSTAATCASCRSTSTEARSPRTSRRTGPAAAARGSRGAAARPARSSRRRRRRSTEVWPLIAFLFEPPVDDEKAWAKVMKPSGSRAARAQARERSRAAEPFDAEALERDLSALVERLGVKARRSSPADPGRDHGRDDLAGDVRVARGARPRADARSGSTRARRACASLRHA